MGPRRSVWLTAALLTLAGCYERGIVPDPNAPVPQVKFDDVTKEFSESMRKGTPPRSAQGQPAPFGPGMAPGDQEGSQEEPEGRQPTREER